MRSSWASIAFAMVSKDLLVLSQFSNLLELRLRALLTDGTREVRFEQVEAG
jgi:hypothetical protein